ncbi:unnamed protein product [Caretta caretta]
MDTVSQAPSMLYASVECLIKLNWALTAPVTFSQDCPQFSQLYPITIKPFLSLLHKRMMGLVLHGLDLWVVLSVTMMCSS